jgi:four helix bundle protein
MSADLDVTEITAWRLAHQLNLRVDLFLLSPDFRQHFTSVDRLGNAARSAPRQIAEGFASDRQAFAARLRIAKGSQAEVLAHLADAYAQRLITMDELLIAERLARRAIRAVNGLIRVLESANGAPAASTRKSRRLIPRVPTGLD